MAYADYAFYTDVYGGSQIPEESFLRLANMASAYIDVQTHGRAKNATAEVLDAIKMTTCNLSDVFNDEDNINAVAFSGEVQVASESVGSWSKSYTKNDVSGDKFDTIEKRKRDVLLLWLGNTGLLSAKAYYVRGDCL